MCWPLSPAGSNFAGRAVTQDWEEGGGGAGAGIFLGFYENDHSLYREKMDIKAGNFKS